MRAIAIIPARFASQRLPGKPLRLLGGIPIFVRVWQNISKCNSIEKAIIATDDDSIAQIARDFGVPFVMTMPEHPSGTDRIHEALEILGGSYDIVVNVQGDEPFLMPEDVDLLIKSFDTSNFDVATFVSRIQSFDELTNPNIVKAVVGNYGRALYFSRSPLPYHRDFPLDKWLENRIYFKHIGVYAYKSDALRKFVSLEPSDLEIAEKLEQLRLMQAGFAYQCVELDKKLIGIDTAEDLKNAELMIKEIKYD